MLTSPALGADVPRNGFRYHRVGGRPIAVLHQFKSGFGVRGVFDAESFVEVTY